MNNELNKIFKGYNTLRALGIELTRRCNLKCDFCMKGVAQDLDMDKDMVDEILEKVKSDDIIVEKIQLDGGEPFLCEDTVEYLVERIIAEHVIVGRISAFTNGTIKSEKIRNAFLKFIEYWKGIETEFMRKASNPESYMNENAFVVIIVSTNGHPTGENLVNDAVEFYSCDSKIYALSQKEQPGDPEVLFLSGRLKENYEKLLKKDYNTSKLRIPINKYNLKIFTFKNGQHYVQKKISIASNGNVYPGYAFSYEDEDRKPMFNILDESSFMQAIVDFAWEHPVNIEINSIREMVETRTWCKNHGFSIKKLSKNDTVSLSLLYKLTFAQEEVAKELHKQHPMLNLEEIDMLASLVTSLNLYNEGFNDNQVKNYLKAVSNIDGDNKEQVSNPELLHEWIRGLAEFIINKDLERRPKFLNLFFPGDAKTMLEKYLVTSNHQTS